MSSNIKVSIAPRTLRFAFPVRTSRGALQGKTSYFVFLTSGRDVSVGEGAPLPGLSLEGASNWQELNLAVQGRTFALPGNDVSAWAKQVFAMCNLQPFASGLFALETAALHLLGGGEGLLYDNGFTNREKDIEINGLVWMDDLEAMLAQGLEKAKAGFTCVKFKIGSKSWEDERRMLQLFRTKYPADVVQVRVDANGAYNPDKARYVLDDLADLGIHSIEQPIAAGQHNAMAALVRESPIPIALDEELITRMPRDEVMDMVRYIRAPYLVLKPSLIGGLGWAADLITLVDGMGLSWWLTSSLETAVGLNALAQFCGNYKLALPQGLSTGNIYSQKIATPTKLVGHMLQYDPTMRLTAAEVLTLLPPDPAR